MAYRSTSSAVASAASVINPASPSGAIGSDILVGVMFGFIQTGSRTIGVPSGWSLVGSDTGDANYATYVYVAKGDVASNNFTFSGNVDIGMRIDCFSGRNTTTPVTASAVVNKTDGNGSVVSSAISSASGDDLFIVLTNNQGIATYGGTPSGLTDISQINTSGASSFAAYRASLPGGTTSTYSRTESLGFNSRTAVTIALAAASSGPTVSTVSSNSNAEGSAIVHTVTLSAATTASTNFAASLAGVTATGADFTPALDSATYSAGVTFSGGNMVVPNGVSSWTVAVPTTQDALNEANETYTLTVGGVSGTGTITDNDPLPALSINDATQSGNNVTFTVTLNPVSGRAVTVNYATANGTKTAGVDYTATSGTMTFAPGETTKQIVVPVL